MAKTGSMPSPPRPTITPASSYDGIDGLRSRYNTIGTRPVKTGAELTQKNTFVLGMTGQSNAACWCNTLYTPTNPNAFQINQFDGNLYPATDPLFGADGWDQASAGGSWGGRFLDKRLARGLETYGVVACCAHGSTRSARWALPNDEIYGPLKAAYQKLKWLGLEFDAICHMQGEGDANDAVSQATYAANFAAYVSNVRTIGITCPIFNSQTSFTFGWDPSTGYQTMLADGAMTPHAIRAGQLGAHSPASKVYCLVDTDTVRSLTGGSPQRTGAHTTGQGADDIAALFEAAVATIM